MNHPEPAKKDVLLQLLDVLSDVIIFMDSLSLRELPDPGPLSGVAHIQKMTEVDTLVISAQHELTFLGCLTPEAPQG